MSVNPRPKIKSLSFEHVSFHYENAGLVFENVNFEFPVDKFVWVHSHQSGSGRSTLLQILAGLEQVSAGKYKINDKNVADMSFEEFLPYRLSIGYSFDFGGLLHNKTLFENLMLPLAYHKLCPYREAEKRVNHHMEAMGILRYKDQRPSSVQGSVRKITCLLRPLLIQPQVLLLDDPSIGVGQDLFLKYLDLIQDLRKNGFAQHIFISTFDEKMMGLIEHQKILIDQNQLIVEDEGTQKKVVNL